MQKCDLMARIGSDLLGLCTWLEKHIRGADPNKTSSLSLDLPHFSVSGEKWIFDAGRFLCRHPICSPGRSTLSPHEVNVITQYTFHLSPCNTAARSTGRYERPGLKTYKEEFRRCAAPCFAVLTPAITISPDPFVSLPV